MQKTSISLYRQANPGIWVGALLLVFSHSAQADQFFLSDRYRGAVFEHAMARWQLTNLRTISQGEVTYPREGTLIRQYELQADAASILASIGVPTKVRFRLLMDVFSPAYDMGGQKQGKYYVQGRWELLGRDDVRQSADGTLSGRIQGRVQAELAFDPTVENRDWKGNVRISTSRVLSKVGKLGVRLMRAGGELAFTPGDGGTLALDLKLWPRF